MNDAGLDRSVRKGCSGSAWESPSARPPRRSGCPGRPRLRGLFITDSQNLAPSLSEAQRSRTSHSPSRATPKAIYTALSLTIRLSASRTFTCRASKTEEDQKTRVWPVSRRRIGYIRSKAWFCRSRTLSRTASFGGAPEPMARSRLTATDQVGADIQAVKVFQMGLNVPHRQACGLEPVRHGPWTGGGLAPAS